MTTQAFTFLPVLLLDQPGFKRELQLAVKRTWKVLPREDLDGTRAREDFWEYAGKILARHSFQVGHLHIVLPYFDDILRSHDPRTLENFKNTGAIRNPDLIQVLSLAMQAVDLNFRQFVVSFALDYEANPYRETEDEDEDWGYLPR